MRANSVLIETATEYVVSQEGYFASIQHICYGPVENPVTYWQIKAAGPSGNIRVTRVYGN